eukprot:TRINITY_DN19328_c0_g1_i1.p1 TRINITY_DN19328_c0_g1~~TRINITY_DN19328_c0_g1_i1.p1  ORF type:complete len:272 (-),score=36.29 TRINITY_DN19328_c0_g1_i1:562-1377(-)
MEDSGARVWFKDYHTCQLGLGIFAACFTAAICLHLIKRATFRRGAGTHKRWSLVAMKSMSEQPGAVQHEFSYSSELEFASLGKAMRVVAFIFVIKALVVNGALSFGTYWLHSNPELVPSEVFGEFAEMFDYLFFAFFLRRAAHYCELITTSTGSDMTNLMRGIATLVAFFKRLVIVGIILVVKGVASTSSRLSQLASLRAKGESVQVASTLPFGWTPPAWTGWLMPLCYSFITIFMIVFGIKSLQDEVTNLSKDCHTIQPVRSVVSMRSQV